MLKLLTLITLLGGSLVAQESQREKEIRRGSRIAKDGFKNEDDIRDKFDAWQTDKDAQAWLLAMNYRLVDIKSVKAVKPSRQKSDVEVRIRTTGKEAIEGISIKLVSSPNGFNQVDKRWLSSYAKMWEMPKDVVNAMKLYVGETPPVGKTKRDNRTYLTELPAESRDAVIDFFRRNKARVVSDLLAGDGKHAAKWFMVTLKSKQGPPRWAIRSMSDTIRFYAEGEVVMTRVGNLKLGRVSMQRKGGDNGRPTANMLQFKLNPVLLFSAQVSPLGSAASGTVEPKTSTAAPKRPW